MPTTRTPAKTALWHGGVNDFLRRFAIDIAGGLTALAAVLLLLALSSHTSSDPSFNTAGPGATTNLMGPFGAWISDMLLQTMGAAAWALVIVAAGWAWRLLSHRGLGRFWLRLTMVPISLLALSIALDGTAAGAGGITGSILAADLARLGGSAGVPSFVVTVVAFVIAIPALLIATGLRRPEWLAMARGSAWTARLGWKVGKAGGRAGWGQGQAAGRALWRLAHRRRHADLQDDREDDFGDFDIDEVEVEEVDDTDPGAEFGDGRREPTLGRLRRTRSADPDEEPAGAAKRARPAPKVEPPKKRPAKGKRAVSDAQASLDFDSSHRLPPPDILDEIELTEKAVELDKEALEQNARLLESVLEDFGVRGEIVKVRPGPVVTLYELEPAPGTKSSRVIGLSDDIARSMSAISVRVAVIPGRNVIGIELPNAKREIVGLREMVASRSYEQSAAQLTLVLGKDIGGTPILVDLARMPHLLVAGTTGSGKSVAINAMILSLLYRLSPEQCRFIMIDPKMLELSVYDGIPHLLAPVVTDPNKAVVALRWAVREMEDRYRAMSNLGVRNIGGYNARVAEAAKKGETILRTVQTGFDPESGEPIYEDQPLDMTPLPYIVVIVDEMADLMLVAGKEVEAAVQRLAQMARAAGIHLIMATQRPSVDVITGTIKANFPTRISFQVTSKIDSRTILGEAGAEQLLGMGDMLYMAGGGRITRVHGPFVSDEEVERVVGFLRDQGQPDYVESVTEEDDGAPPIPGIGPLPESAGGGSPEDQLYDQAVALVCRERKASTSFVQRHLQIGYNRAARIIERMESEGVISRANHVGKREVLARDIDDRAS